MGLFDFVCIQRLFFWKRTFNHMPVFSVLEEIVDRLVRALHPERVYLFGSRARGDSEPASDFDILVVVANSELPGFKRDRLALRALRGVGAAVDVIVLTRREFDRKRDVVCSLPATVRREGKLLYAA
jgi:predicted nucleotidyltransferase